MLIRPSLLTSAAIVGMRGMEWVVNDNYDRLETDVKLITNNKRYKMFNLI